MSTEGSNVVIVNLADWQRLSKKLTSEMVKPIVEEALETVANLIKPAIASRAPRFSGRLAKSVISVIRYTGGPLPAFLAIGPKAPHRFLVERGTKPHFPETTVETKDGRRLRRWVRRKIKPQAGLRGPAAEREIARAAYRIARGISKRGSKAQPFLRPAWKATETQVEGILRKAGQRLEQEWLKI